MASTDDEDIDRTSEHADEAAARLQRRRFLAGSALGIATLAASAGCGERAASAQAPRPARASTGGERPRRRFEDQVVLITGATSGIGEAAAYAFAAEGAHVFFCGRREELGARVQARIRDAGGRATYVRADVREEAEVAALVRRCVEEGGRLDIALNNAGIGGPVGDPLELPIDGEGGYRDLYRTNVDGVYFAMRHELPVMLRAGRGVILNVASIQGSGGAPTSSAYASTKHAVIGLSRSFALAYAERGIRILSVSPGATDTAMLRRDGADVSGIARDVPVRRVAEPREIADVVLHLAAPEASFLTGEDVKIDGGASAAI